MEFEWDKTKEAANMEKHGIGFAAAAKVLLGECVVSEDTRKDYGETRQIAYGHLNGRLLVVVFYPSRGYRKNHLRTQGQFKGKEEI